LQTTFSDNVKQSTFSGTRRPRARRKTQSIQPTHWKVVGDTSTYNDCSAPSSSKRRRRQLRLQDYIGKMFEDLELEEADDEKFGKVVDVVTNVTNEECEGYFFKYYYYQQPTSSQTLDVPCNDPHSEDYNEDSPFEYTACAALFNPDMYKWLD
jgi:hypothetical protein